MPPPNALALLPLIVQSTRWTVPRSATPPPSSAAMLPLIVHPVNVPPEYVSTPPPSPYIATLLLMTQLVAVSDAVLLTPPPVTAELPVIADDMRIADPPFHMPPP